MQTLAIAAAVVAALACVAVFVMYLLRQHARAEVAALQGRVRVLEHDLARERATVNVASSAVVRQTRG